MHSSTPQIRIGMPPPPPTPPPPPPLLLLLLLIQMMTMMIFSLANLPFTLQLHCS
jgi:hypothetical protein